jgi:hypothetical protein
MIVLEAVLDGKATSVKLRRSGVTEMLELILAGFGAKHPEPSGYMAGARSIRRYPSVQLSFA